MSMPALLRWCPYCQRATESAPLPQMAADSRRLRRLRPGCPQAFSRRLYCLACNHIWGTLELPEEHIQTLLARDAEIEQLRRELAMAKLLLAKDARREVANVEAPETIPIRRAA